MFKFCWIALFNMLECDNGMVYDNVLCCFACLNVWLIICEAIASYVKFCCCCELYYFRIACLVCWSYRDIVYIVLKPSPAQRVDLGPGWPEIETELGLWKIREVKNLDDLWVDLVKNLVATRWLFVLTKTVSFWFIKKLELTRVKLVTRAFSRVDHQTRFKNSSCLSFKTISSINRTCVCIDNIIFACYHHGLFLLFYYWFLFVVCFDGSNKLCQACLSFVC